MKLIVGLGNVGRRYEGTRHNVGFDVIAELARRHATGAPRLAFQGETLDVEVGNQRCLLLSPHTLMNRSGRSVGAAKDFYKLTNAEVLIVCDDFHLPLGQLRIRSKGSSGGQKGLEDIIRQVGDDFPRLRLGIGEPPPSWETADYVLSKFTKKELPEIQIAVQRAADAVTCWVSEEIAATMNRYNTQNEI